MTEPFNKEITLEKNNLKAIIKIKFNGVRLSFTGTFLEDNKETSYGQIYDTILEEFPEEKRLVEIWKRWHLNDLRADCEHQRNEKHVVGDLCEICNYSYGSAWLLEEVPQKILEEIK